MSNFFGQIVNFPKIFLIRKLWSHDLVNCECTQHLLSSVNCREIGSVNYEFAQYILGGWLGWFVFHLLTVYLQFTGSANQPLPPVIYAIVLSCGQDIARSSKSVLDAHRSRRWAGTRKSGCAARTSHFSGIGQSGNMFHRYYLPTLCINRERRELQARYDPFFGWVRFARPLLAPKTSAALGGCKNGAHRVNGIRFCSRTRRESEKYLLPTYCWYGFRKKRAAGMLRPISRPHTRSGKSRFTRVVSWCKNLLSWP